MNELPADAIYGLVRPLQVAVSPDGTRVAVRAMEYDSSADTTRNSVFTVPADGSQPPYRLTRISDATTMKWSPDGSRLGVVMARKRDVALQTGRNERNEDRDETSDRTDENRDKTSDRTNEAADEDGSKPSESGADPRPQLWVYDLERGVDAKLVVYPETHHVHHYVAEPGRAIHRLETLSEWFDRFDPALDNAEANNSSGTNRANE